MIDKWANDAAIERVKARIESCPHEILVAIAALENLEESTREFGNDLAADGFTLRAEETHRRSMMYGQSAKALIRIWKR